MSSTFLQAASAMGAAFALGCTLSACAASGDTATPSTQASDTTALSSSAASSPKNSSTQRSSAAKSSAPASSKARTSTASAASSASKTSRRTAASTTRSSTKRSTSAPYPAKALPGWKNCIEDPKLKPSTVMLDCIHEATYVEKVKWKTWSGEQATGAGTYVSNDCGGAPCKKPQRWKVTVVLSDPVETPEGIVFSSATTY